jgi:hypothetical protein
MTVRIVSGTGARQERLIASNTSTTLTVSSSWTVQPDLSSSFVIAQTGYQFGASGDTNQVQFTIPNQSGTVIHICGRSANVYDVESPYELATVTRWQIGGAGVNVMDSDVPPLPVFALTALPEGGGVELGAIGFETLVNTATISLGTLTLHYYDEGSADISPVLAAAIAPTDSTLTLLPSTAYAYPQYLAIGQEVVRLTVRSTDGVTYSADRGVDGTTPAAHTAQAIALPLKQLTVSFPFLENFFGTPASGDWTQSMVLANARICSAEFFVSNSRGNSPVASGAFLSLVGGGLRTLNGGQITLQVPGSLAIQNAAVPPLDPGATYAVRDVYAYVGMAPTGTNSISLQVIVDGQVYCALAIAPGSTQSASVDGSTLAALRAGKQIGLNILSVGDQTPGSDLTVLIRV